MRNFLGTLALAATLTFGPAGLAAANTVTLDFTVTSDVDVSAGTYSEDGYTVDGSSTSGGRILEPNNFLEEGFFLDSEFFTITNDAGKLFTLDAFDYGPTTDGRILDEFEMLGFLGGTQVVDYGTFQSNTLTTETTNNSTLIDTLRISATGNLGGRGPTWDNIVLSTQMTPIPLPAGLPLLLAGMGGLALLRRRKRG